VRIGAEEKANGVAFEISAEGTAVKTRKKVAEGCRNAVSEVDGAREVLDEDFSGKAVLADERG
jgi:hypothetical protein